MERVVADLIDKFEIEKNLYLELESLSLTKKSVILNNDIISLDKIVIEEKALINKINTVNSLIHVITKSLCEHLNITQDDISIDKIIENIFSDELRKVLIELTDETREVFKRLKKLNKINQEMLSKKLKQVKSKMDIIMLDNDPFVYDLEGNDKSGKRQKINIFDARV